jgi:TonB family protein
MVDAAAGLERSIDTTTYSPVANGDRVNAERPPRPADASIDANDAAHQDLASLVRRGAMRLEVGNEAEAEECFRKALEIGDSTLGADHPDLILLLNDLTRIYLRQSAYAAAEPLLLRLLELKRSKGEDHPEVATVLASLGTVRQALGHHESAEQLWRRVLDIREHTLAPNHFAIATALEHFGESCAARGKIREALAAFQRAHAIRERTLGSDHASLRASRERIADLQLQASDESLEHGGGGTSSAQDRYRLLSGEPPAVSSLSPVPVTRERVPGPKIRKAAVMIQAPFSDTVTIEKAPVVEEAAPTGVATAQRESAPYLPVLETIRDELERPDQGVSLVERARAIFARAIAFLGIRQVVAGTVVLVIAALLIAVATGAHGWGEVDQTTALAAAVPNHESLPITASAAPIPVTTHDPVRAPVPAPANATTKAAPQHPRVAEEQNAPRRVTEQKSESKKIVIPTFSTGMMSRLDSLASTAANTSRATEALDFQPAPISLGTQRSNFASVESRGPQRARLIGELPIPRVPDQVADVEGDVRVRFNVDTQGRPVMSTLAVESSPHPLLTNEVRKVVLSLRFEPARSGGTESKPIGDVVGITFQFSRRNR